MAVRSTNTYAEALESIRAQVAQAKVVGDANLPFLVQLETMILAELRSPSQPAAPPQAPSGPSFAGGPGGMPMAGAGGAMPMAAPNADELRRLLS
jgi:hypothetical protein